MYIRGAGDKVERRGVTVGQVSDEGVAVALFPELSDVMDVAMDEGALRAMVSGSGPTLLLAAHSEQDALRLATAVEERTGVAALPVHGPVPGAHVL